MEAHGRVHVYFGNPPPGEESIPEKADVDVLAAMLKGKSYHNFDNPEAVSPGQEIGIPSQDKHNGHGNHTSDPGIPDTDEQYGEEDALWGEHNNQDPCQWSEELDETKLGKVQNIFDRENSYDQEEIFAALVQAEEAQIRKQEDKEGETSRFGQRHRVSLIPWPLDDPELQELLSFWESKACHYAGDHATRLKYLGKYCGFGEKKPSPGELKIVDHVTDMGKVHKYLNFLASKNQAPKTILKSLDVIQAALKWICMIKLVPEAKDYDYAQEYTRCKQIREQLDEIRSAWQGVAKKSDGCATSIGAIIRANKWPSDMEVCLFLSVVLYYNTISFPPFAPIGTLSFPSFSVCS